MADPFSGAETAAIGGAKAGGIAAPADGTVQFDFTGGKLTPTFGDGKLELWDRDASGSYLDGWTVKGTVHAPNTDTGEGALHDRSDAQGKVLLWLGERAKQWTDYRYDATLTSTDNDEIGVVFYYQDADNHYRFTMNSQTQVRELVKVQNGERTVLASEAAGYRFNDAQEVSVVVIDGRIDVLLDGRSVFGPITDTAPLTGGTVGVVSNGQKSSIFDNIAVNKVALTAHGEAEGRGVEGDGISVTAASSFGADEITGYRWLLFGDGDDTIRFTTGSEVFDIDGGAGVNTLRLEGSGAGRIGALDNIQKIELVKGDWTLTDEGADIAMTGGAQRLLLDAGLFADDALAGTITGFGADDRIVLDGIRGFGEPVLTEGNILSVDHADGTLTIGFDPAQNLARADFYLTDVGGGTQIHLEIAKDERLNGTSKADVIDGRGGDDTLSGKSGSDRLEGGRGDDTLAGGSGDDALSGGSGDDMTKAGSGGDTIYGGSGDDTIDGGSGHDWISGGFGSDILSGGSGNDVFVFGAGHGNDRIEDFRTGDILSITTEVFADFNALTAAARQEGRDLVLASADGTILLEKTDLADLSADNCWFI